MATDELSPPGSALTPDQIEQQAFARARKGLDEKQVREFLRRVADEFDALTRRVSELEEELRRPRMPSGQQLVDMVGEEVARTLRSAHQSADEVGARAREHAVHVERAAAEDAQRLRAEQLEQTTQDARAIVEAARERGREMVAEAKALRERVIADLNRRRDMLRAYIEQLRADRDRFAETYRVVTETVGDAHEKLARFESGRPFQPVPVDAGPAPAFPSEPEPAPAPQPEPSPETAAAEVEQSSSAEPEDASLDASPDASRSSDAASTATGIGLGELPGQPEPEAEPAREPEPASEALPESEPQPAPARGADVHALFQRIRAGREQDVEAARTVLDDVEPERENPGPTSPPADTDASATEPEPTTDPQPEATEAGDAELLARRDELITPVAHDLVRRCKRVLQDEQNEVLDALRRRRGRVTPDKLLPPLAAQVAAWAEVMAPAIDEAYVAARTASSPRRPSVSSAPRRIVTGMVEVVVTPLRERLLAAVEETLADDPDPDPDVIAQRIGARYREWKGQELDSRIGDVLAAAYARGVYDATPDGSRLRWVPAEPGQCPDAEDNALEPTPRGERFPTGQQFPPAHPGCRCVLAVVETG